MVLGWSKSNLETVVIPRRKKRDAKQRREGKSRVGLELNAVYSRKRPKNLIHPMASPRDMHGTPIKVRPNAQASRQLREAYRLNAAVSVDEIAAVWDDPRAVIIPVVQT